MRELWGKNEETIMRLFVSLICLIIGIHWGIIFFCELQSDPSLCVINEELLPFFMLLGA